MNHYGPRIILCDGDILCTNTLHKIRFNEDVDECQKIGIAVSMISTFGQLAAEMIGRTYGGGVLKFELTEARLLPVFDFPISKNDARIHNLERALETRSFEAARHIADEMILPHVFGICWNYYANEMHRDLQRVRAFRMLERKSNITT